MQHASPTKMIIRANKASRDSVMDALLVGKVFEEGSFSFSPFASWHCICAFIND